MDRDDLTTAQGHAIETIDANYPLIAGAGTGKTTTLSFRYVRLLEANPELRPREILVTTFTRRAARDLVGAVRKRILDRIADADPDDETDVARWRQVLDELDDAYIHTLHAFCQRVLQEYALDAPDLRPGFELIDDIEASQRQAELIDEVLDTEPDEVELLLDANVTSRYGLANILQDLCGRRPESTEWATYWGHPDRSVDEYIEHVESTFHPLPDDTAREILADQELREAIDGLGAFTADPPMTDTGKASDRIIALIDRIDEAGGLDGPATAAQRRQLIADISDLLTKADGDTYASYSPKKSTWQADDDHRKAIGDKVETVVTAIDVTRWGEELGGIDLDTDRVSVPYVFALARLFESVEDRYQSYKREHDLVDYTDLIQRTRELLADTVGPNPVREALQDQFEYVMIDEVQDTDPGQWDIVGDLTRLGDDHPHYSNENVFIVGDEKQSIFRFRGADVAVFEETRGDLVAVNSRTLAALIEADADEIMARTGDRPGFELARNFRTLPSVLEFINGLFEGILTADDADRPPFEAPPQPLVPARDNTQSIDTVTEYLLVPDQDMAPQLLAVDHQLVTEPAYHRRSNEARAVAARITHILADGTEIYPEDADDDTSTARAVEPDDIAVILRKRTHLQAFKQAFESESIPYSVVRGDGFFDTPEVQTLLNLLHAVVDPSDGIALYGVLRSPLFGIPDTALARYAQQDDFWAAIRDAEERELRRAVTVLCELRSMAGLADGGPVVDDWTSLLDWVLDQTGFIASVSADERPRQAVANIDKFRDLLASYDERPSLQEVLDRLTAEQDHADYSPEASVPDGSPGVQLMTVHAAKGDEFPVVIVPGICDTFNTQSPINNSLEFETIGDRPELGMRVPDPENPFETVDTVARQGIRDERMRRLRAEERRILYVACTRARDHLILAGTHSGTITDDGNLELEDTDEEEPDSWRDLVQPHLLDDERVLAGLHGDEDRITAVLADEYRRESAEVQPQYSVVLPEEPVSIDDQAVETAPKIDAELTPPTRDTPSYRLSPSQLADLESDDPDGSLIFDESMHTVRYRRPDDEDISTRQHSTEEGTRTLYGRVFGEAVHRICELRPPRTRWDAVIEDTLVAMEYDHDITATDREAVCEHAQRAIEYVESEMTPETMRYDEFEATANLPGGRLHGFIDCLLVDGGDYHVVDYKTGNHDLGDLDAKTAYYQPQLDAYAAMLAATATVDTVTTTLYYTAPEAAQSTVYDKDPTPSKILESVDERIQALRSGISG